jgi:hypothetical protein
MGDAKLVQPTNEPAGTVEQIELIFLAAIHTGVDYRMDESLPFLAQALSG